MKPLRPHKEVLRDWVAEVATKVGRPEAELLSRGLNAMDFSSSRFVEVRFPFGLVHRLSSAFAVVRPQTGEAAVFSEHAGYVEFQLLDECVVAEIAESIYYHEA